MEKNLQRGMEQRIKELERQLEEAADTIEAIRTGQIDALVVNHENVPALYTLQSADHAYRVFIEKMAEGAVTLNSDGLIVYCNSRFASMVQQPLTRVIGNSFYNFIAAEEQALLRSLFTKRWEHNIKREIFLTMPHHQVPVQLSMNPLVLEGITSLNIIVTDLSFQKEHQQQLKEKNDLLIKLNEALSESNHDLQQFASIASHDLQEPLRKIQVYAKFLKDKNYDHLPDISKTHLEKIIASAVRMKTLIVDILTYSRLSMDDTPIEKIPLHLIVQEIIDDFDLKIQEKNAVIVLEELPEVEVNRSQLRQVFTNLISNALKFTETSNQPRIEIKSKPVNAKELGLSLNEKEAYCRISVKDNGIGFDEKYASSIFSLFERLNAKSTFEGSGIGLAIAKKIIDKHHGIIVGKSTEGHGAEFNILLPLQYSKEYVS